VNRLLKTIQTCRSYPAKWSQCPEGHLLRQIGLTEGLDSCRSYSKGSPRYPHWGHQQETIDTAASSAHGARDNGEDINLILLWHTSPTMTFVLCLLWGIDQSVANDLSIPSINIWQQNKQTFRNVSTAFLSWIHANSPAVSLWRPGLAQRHLRWS